MPVFRSLLVALALVSFGTGAELRTLAGKVIKGDLVSVDGQAIVLSSGGENVSTPVKEVLQLDLQPAGPARAAKYTDVEMTDGSRLQCEKFTLKGKFAELTVLGGVSVKVPLTAINYLLTNAHDPKVRQEWQTFLSGKKITRDQLVVRANDVLNGLEGTFGDGDDKGETIEFELASGRKIRPNLARVQGLVFVHQPAVNIPPTLCKVHDTHRNLLVATRVALADGKFTVTTVSGVKVEYSDRQLLSRLDYSKGKLTYLSDLDPATVEESSTEERIDHYRRDKNLDDGPIKLAGKVFGKGLSLHSRTVLVYDIAAEYNEFRFTLGVDEQVGGDSQARVTVEGDGRPLFNREVKRTDKPENITLNVKGVKRLRITVASEFLDLGNHVTLADALVSK